jgi:hypothetical protein
VIKRWQKRYFVLSGPQLQYYLEKEQVQVKRGVCVRRIINLNTLHKMSSNSTFLSITLHLCKIELRGQAKHTQLQLKCANGEEFTKWTRALKLWDRSGQSEQKKLAMQEEEEACGEFFRPGQYYPADLWATSLGVQQQQSPPRGQPNHPTTSSFMASPVASSAPQSSLIEQAETGWPSRRPGGMENAGNTCYMDALIFAMFATSVASDHLLVRECDESAVEMQLQLRCAVRTIRRGVEVPLEDMSSLRLAARATGWEPQLYEQQSHEQVCGDNNSTILTTIAPTYSLLLPQANEHEHDDYDSFPQQDSAQFMCFAFEQLKVG